MYAYNFPFFWINIPQSQFRFRTSPERVVNGEKSSEKGSQTIPPSKNGEKNSEKVEKVEKCI